MSRSLLILGPDLPREAAQELRRLAAEREGRQVHFASLGGHTEGQELPHDVVAIGDGKPDIERDVRGTFKRYASLDECRADLTSKPARDPATDSFRAMVEVAASVKPGPDKFEAMDRVQLIRYGAEHFPRQRQWATLDSERLKAALRELEAAH